MHINYSKSELHLLSEHSRGIDRIVELAERMNVSNVQIYRMIKNLSMKDTVELKNGTLVVRNKTHIVQLLNILRNSQDAYIPLSDSGLEIMLLLINPITMAEISEKTGLNVSTVSRKIKEMLGLSMISKDGKYYSINNKIWPELKELCFEITKYEENTDLRIPPGCKIYHSDKKFGLFSSSRRLPFNETAFSVFGEYGIKMFSGIHYYTTEKRKMTIEDVFIHTLYVASKENDWKLKIMSLIFYVKNKDVLQGVSHSLKNEMDQIISGKKVDGWIPVEEIQERADMYGVKILNRD